MTCIDEDRSERSGLLTRRQFASGIAGSALMIRGSGVVASPALRGLASMTLAEASMQIRRRKVSSVALTEACLDRIREFQPLLNAFITITAQQALERARVLDAELDRGHWRGPLHGVPIALKDELG